MTTKREPTRSGAEVDAVDAKNSLVFRRGERAYLKRAIRRRERQAGRREARREV